MNHIVIVGGGISGLAAAYYLQKKSELPTQITILEQAAYWGGKIITEQIDERLPGGGFIIEGGPDTFVVTKPWALRLCKELGIVDRLRGTNPHTNKTYILKNEQLYEIPGGLTMMIPTEFGPLLRTGLLSWAAKARMAMDFYMPPARINSDETLGAFVTRRLGREAYENMIEPLVSGIYAGDGDRLSLQSTFPTLRDLETEHGGLVRGALALRRERLRKARANGNSPRSGARSIFLTPLNGLAEIVEALVAALKKAGVTLRLGTVIQEVVRTAQGYQVRQADGQVLSTENVILATPAYVTAGLIAGFAPQLSSELRVIEYVSTATISLAYPETDLPRPLDGYGYVIPRRAGRKALACTWTSKKFPHRAPHGYALLRIFIGRAGQENVIAWDEDSLLQVAREELRLTLGITSQPLIRRIYRWDKAMPQYNLGHPERLARLDRSLAPFPNMALAGNAYCGIGIPDCIHSGEVAADRILSAIRRENPVQERT